MFDFDTSGIPNLKPAYAPQAKKVTARWNLPDLMTAFASAGWGPLAGGEHQGLRSVLYALTAKVNHYTGRGHTTAYQLADAAGLSERWTRVRLSQLEELGLIEWTRGGILRGHRQPSYFKVVKKKLAELIRLARNDKAARNKKRAAEFAKRLSLLSKTTILRGKVPVSPELSTSPSPLKGEVIKPTSPGGKNLSPSSERGTQTMINRPVPQPSHWVEYCKHTGTSDPAIIYSCPDCRFDSLSPAEEAEYDGQLHRLEEEERRRGEQTLTAKDIAFNNFLAHYYPGVIHGPALARRYMEDVKEKRVPEFNAWYEESMKAGV